MDIDLIISNFTDDTQQSLLLIGSFIDANTLKLAGSKDLSIRPSEFNEENTKIFKRN